MKCYACERTFCWTAVDLAVPCRSYHYSRTFPFVHQCKHAASGMDIPWRRKAEFYMQRAALTAPFIALLAPAIAPAAVLAGAAVLRAKYKQRRKQYVMAYRRRHAQEWMRRTSDEQHQQYVETSACRVTGNHEYVLDWCAKCGQTRA